MPKDDSRRSRPGPAATAKSNIRDVARLAGVSTATVSRVLAGADIVRAETVDRVMDAIKKLDYVANGHALALTGRAPGAVALISNVIAVDSFSQVAAGAEAVSSEENHMFTLFATHNDPEREVELIGRLREQRAAAALWLGAARLGLSDDRFIDYARQLDTVGTKLVIVGRSRFSLPHNIPIVDYANESGMADLVRYLLELGHRRILFVGRDPDNSTALARFAGYVRAHQEVGIDIDPQLTRDGLFTLESGRDEVEAALESNLRFTAVVASADFIAIGAMRAITSHGLRIPQDISAGGFDDMRYAADLTVPLTTVRAPFADLGRHAAEIALGLRQPSDEPLPTTLIVRASTSQPNITI